MATEADQTIYERDALDAIPHGKRDFNFWALLFIFMGIQVPVSYFITGGSITAGLTLGQAFLTTVVAAAIGFLIFALVGLIGWQTGTSTMVGTRAAFGVTGSLLPALITYIELTGWDSVHVQLAGKLMGTIAQPWGFDQPRVFSVAVGVILAALVIWGHRVLKIMERLLVPIVVVLVALALYTVLRTNNLGALWGHSGKGGLTLMLAFDAMLIAILTWCPMVSDYTRFGQGKKGAFLAAWMGSLPVALFMLFVGQSSAIGTGNPNALIAMVNTGGLFSVFAFCIAMFATIATAALIMYSASMAALNVFPHVPLRTINIITGLIVIVASVAFDLLGNVIGWLTIQGVLLIPLFAVLLMDYFVVRGRNYDAKALFQKGGPYWGFKGFNLDGYAAWIVGAVVYPLAARALPSFGGSVLSFVAAAAVYWVLASWRARRNAAVVAPEPAAEA